jgi:hypothetical protein
MKTRFNSRLLLALPVVMIGAFSVTAASKPASLAPACTLTADSIKAGQTSGTVQARLTESIGDSLSASIAPAAKISVVDVKAGTTPMTAQITVNAQQGVAGEWELTLAGKNGTCSGTVAVITGK